MRDDEREGEPAPPSIGRAIRDAFPRYVDEIVVFVVANVAWALVLAAFALARLGIPVLVVLMPLLALPTTALMRLAVAEARDRSPTLAMARAELGRVPGRKLALATVQLLVLVFGVTNVFVGSGIGGVGGAASAIVAGYAVIATSVYALALWPIVCDPDREAPVRDQLRLALAVILVRPLQMIVLAVLTGLAAIVSVQLILPIVFLPTLVLLVVAGYVVPVADGLRPA